MPVDLTGLNVVSSTPYDDYVIIHYIMSTHIHTRYNAAWSDYGWLSIEICYYIIPYNTLLYPMILYNTQ